MDLKGQKLTLGKALAYLNAGRIAEKQLSALSKEYLQRLSERWKSIVSSEDVDSILKSVPENCCHSEKPHLADNEDFFLARILVSPVAGDSSKNCLRLMSHLNECFRCFEEFCWVFGEYYHKSQELS